MLAKHLLTCLVAATTVNACARPVSAPTRGVVINSGCPTQRPTSWANSQFRITFGQIDSTLDAQSGALVFEVQIDSIPGPQGAQVSVRTQTIRRDTAFAGSPIRMTVPAGRYSFRVQRIGAQTLQDSVDVRSGNVDTVKVILGREVVCLLFNSSTT